MSCNKCRHGVPADENAIECHEAPPAPILVPVVASPAGPIAMPGEQPQAVGMRVGAFWPTISAPEAIEQGCGRFEERVELN